MDLDPNYDPSDFLHMSTKTETAVQIDYSNIKQEPQSQIYEQDSSFSMSEMLLYERGITKTEHQSESSEMTVQPQVIDFSSHEIYAQETTSPNQNTPRNEIHDDLAISDSDEEQQQRLSSKNQFENANDNDTDLWF